MRPDRSGGHAAPGRAGDTGGFTLIEVVAALAILGLLLAVALPRLQTGMTKPRLEALALRVAALLDGDRRSAMLRHTVVASTISVSQRLVRSGTGGTDVAIPAGVTVSSALARTCLGAPNGDHIRFLPSGMSCGGAITFEGAGRAVDVRVDWLTGTSTIASR